jgi:hypothetical protein
VQRLCFLFVASGLSILRKQESQKILENFCLLYGKEGILSTMQGDRLESVVAGYGGKPKPV